MIMQLIAHQMFFRSVVHIIARLYHHKAVLFVHQAQADSLQPRIRAAVFFVEFIPGHINPFFFFGRRASRIGLVFGYFPYALSLSVVLVICGFRNVVIRAALPGRLELVLP